MSLHENVILFETSDFFKEVLIAFTHLKENFLLEELHNPNNMMNIT